MHTQSNPKYRVRTHTIPLKLRFPPLPHFPLPFSFPVAHLRSALHHRAIGDLLDCLVSLRQRSRLVDEEASPRPPPPERVAEGRGVRALLRRRWRGRRGGGSELPATRGGGGRGILKGLGEEELVAGDALDRKDEEGLEAVAARIARLCARNSKRSRGEETGRQGVSWRRKWYIDRRTVCGHLTLNVFQAL